MSLIISIFYFLFMSNSIDVQNIGNHSIKLLVDRYYDYHTLDIYKLDYSNCRNIRGFCLPTPVKQGNIFVEGTWDNDEFKISPDIMNEYDTEQKWIELCTKWFWQCTNNRCWVQGIDFVDELFA